MVWRGREKPHVKLMPCCCFFEIGLSTMVTIEIMFEWWDSSFDGSAASIICIIIGCVFTAGWLYMFKRTYEITGFKEQELRRARQVGGRQKSGCCDCLKKIGRRNN